VEVDRTINVAYVIGQESGEINKGDLLSVLNLYPIMFTREPQTGLRRVMIMETCKYAMDSRIQNITKATIYALNAQT